MRRLDGMFTLLGHSEADFVVVRLLVRVMMQVQAMGSKRAMPLALAALLTALLATTSTATQPNLPTLPQQLGPGAADRAATLPLLNAPLLDVFDVADAPAHDAKSSAQGDVICLAGCSGPRGSIVHAGRTNPWHVASIDPPTPVQAPVSAAPARLVAECVAGCGRPRDGAGNRAAAAETPALATRLPQREIAGRDAPRGALLTVRDAGRRAHGPQRSARAQSSTRSTLRTRPALTWAVAQRTIRVR